MRMRNLINKENLLFARSSRKVSLILFPNIYVDAVINAEIAMLSEIDINKSFLLGIAN